jgi:hypothetical protein
MRATEVEIGEGRRERRKREERARVLREQAPVIDAIVTKVTPACISNETCQIPR